ncbi:MAG: glycosyltransferase family 4 protein [Verrucomicrobiales bacterium]|jgi:glycosyltransferase involved in cell wall biosynthesis|nr:glycosyltransferase family 4 protein [Verrucomicrobiales bacterium]
MKGNVLHIFASRTWGGGEQYVFDLAQRQIENGCRVVLLSGDSKVIRDKVKPLNCRYFSLRYRWHFNPFSIARVRNIILREQTEVVHVHQFRDAFIAVFATLLMTQRQRPRIVMTRHLAKRGKNFFLYRWMYSRLHKLIFVSALARREFLKGARIPENKIAVVHNSLAARNSSGPQTDYRKQYGLGADCLLVGFVGGIAKFKGVELLLEVAEKLRDKNAVFLLAGRGTAAYELFLKQLIASKNLESHFHLIGFVDNPASFIIQTDLGVMPSLCVEAFGLAALEFMRQGVPVIVSDTGAQMEFVENGKTGLIVAPNVAELSAAVEKLLADADWRASLGARAREFSAQALSYDVFFEKIMKLYGFADHGK